MTNCYKVVAFAGSLRKESLNRTLLRCAISSTPENMTIEQLDIYDVPLYNGDIEEQGPPKSVIDFKESIAAADGLLIVTPEYNYGVPAVTKNLIDWASRRNSHPGNVLSNKPVAIMTVTASTRGNGALARSQVREVLVAPGAIPMPAAGFGLGGGQSNFDSSGNLVNESVLTQLQQTLSAFADWIQKLEV